MKKHYIVTLTSKEREELKNITTKGKKQVRTVKHASALLKADQSEGGPNWSDKQISLALDMGTATIERLRKRFVEEGLDAALKPRKESSFHPERKLDGHKEAQLVTLVCSDPPDGYAQLSLRLLADKLVELEIVESISHETVRQTLKKTKLSLG
jgi:transposase